jgi:hypothetical protein
MQLARDPMGIQYILNALDPVRSEKNMTFAPYLSAHVDLHLQSMLFYEFIGLYDYYDRPTLSDLEQLCHEAIRLDDAHWHGHYMLGAILACRFRWKEAQEAFDKAMTRNPDEAVRRFWVPSILVGKRLYRGCLVNGCCGCYPITRRSAVPNRRRYLSLRGPSLRNRETRFMDRAGAIDSERSHWITMPIALAIDIAINGAPS